MSDGELDDRWLFRTSGPNCHWCASGETIHVWGPYGTNVCAFCEDLITQGRPWEVAEAVAARITVRDRWYDLDPERWLEHERALIERWLTLRRDCTEVPPGRPHCESQLLVDAENRYVIGCDRVNVHDGPHRAEVTGGDDVTQRHEWPAAG
jgi:hypothetical protein